jgi:drug/metabolite transporter (DMT)-like permease
MIANMAIVYAALTDVFFFKESLSTAVLIGCGGVILITSLLGLVKTCNG